MTDGRMAVLSYRYVSLMFIFQLAFSKEWHLIGRDRAADQIVSREQLLEMYGQALPDLNIWKHYGLAIAIGAIAVFAVVASAF